MKTQLMIIASAALLASTTSCSDKKEHLKSLNTEYLDTEFSPGSDFYSYVNSGWQKAHPLDAEHARFSQFNLLADTAEARIKDIVLNLAQTNPEPNSVAFKVATVYTQAMDSVRLNNQGAAPIKPLLDKIEETTPDAMEDLFIWMHTNFASPFFSAGPMEDLMDSNQYAMYVSAARLGMGDRDYYLLNDDRNTTVREAYKTLIVNQMQNAGYSVDDARRIMDNVMKYETDLADQVWTREQSRNIPAQYNPRPFDFLKKEYPNFPWDRFFIETMGIESPQQVIVTELNTVKKGNELMAKLTDRQKKDYYLWCIVRGAQNQLSDRFADTAFEYSKVVSGVQEQRPRWKRAVSATERALGEAIGELYVEKYFPESSKQYMIGLVENLRTALGQHIDNLTWMSDSTKTNARKKLASFTVKIGYPDKWKDYSSMDIDPEKSYFDNMHAVQMWQQADRYAKWGKPVDKTEWGMTPQTVNAYYNPMANEIVFPAGILQAPYFDPQASDAENYGGIGVVIGHEMTHGFDDQGRNFDHEGNMIDWWTKDDADKFSAMAQTLVEQFNAVEVLPGVFANGQYTLGENIADQGGLRVSMTAFLNAQQAKGIDVKSPDALIDGFTPEQVFYLNYANIWATNIRDEEIQNLTTGDTHSLGRNRVNVTLRNIAPFFEAFGITEGDALYRPEADRVVIW